MATSKKDRIRKKRRTLRVRHELKKSVLPRVSVFRSLKHIYAQLINDFDQKTLASFSSLELKDASGDKKAMARKVGRELAKRAKEIGIQEAVFDRGPYRFHGRVKEIAEGLREESVKV